MGEIADEIVNNMLFGRPRRRYRKVYPEEPRDYLTDEDHAVIRRQAAEEALDAELDDDQD